MATDEQLSGRRQFGLSEAHVAVTSGDHRPILSTFREAGYLVWEDFAGTRRRGDGAIAAGRAWTWHWVELCGSAGYGERHLLEKWARDTKILDLFEGTQQI